MNDIALNLLEGLVDRVLALDEESASRLRLLQGRVLAIEAVGTDLTVHVRCGASRLQLAPAGAEKPDVTISGTPLELLAQLGSARPAGARASLRISGDVELAQEFQRIVRGVDPDWEEGLAGWLGDSAAHRICNVMRGARRMARDSGSGLGLDFAEYLRYEKELLPDRRDIAGFSEAVDRLREDTDRLKARLQRVAGAMTGADR